MKLSLISAFVLVMVLSAYGQEHVTLLSHGWKFRRVGEQKWSTAAVPGNIYTDLFFNHIISDPFFGDNEKSVQWVDTCNWEYELNFINPTQPDEQQELVFEGLDTYADVFINDSLWLKCSNMFVSHKLKVRDMKSGNNSIRVVFHSAVKEGKAAATHLPYTLPGEERVFTRKAAFSYGWDFAPRLVGCGIWKNVFLHSWKNYRIDNIQFVQKSLTDSLAILEFKLKVISEAEKDVDFLVNINKDRSRVHLNKGENSITKQIRIRSPKRWWCNGLGEPFLYSVKFQFLDEKQITSEEVEFGLRTLELVQDSDKIGKGFFFRLNGVPVFAKGANYIPDQYFTSQLSKGRTDSLLQLAKDANMNMIRVWGGGIYPSDEIYKSCDKKGILVWQDMMFACAMYPGDDAFLKSVREEISQNVIRLRNHPSLALWCGNNENDEGWKNWEWQKQYNYSNADSSEIYRNYLKLFNELIPEVLQKEDSAVPYWPSSPSIGWGHVESLMSGDAHYWGVWWGMEPFDMYEKKVGRFMSEYGFQGMPSLQTLKKYLPDSALYLFSVALKSHQKHSTGFETIDTYMKRRCNVPADFEKYIYASQIIQADGMQIAIQAHRRAKPDCMGTLYWQLNDCWPGISWSSIDYDLHPKALYYETKRSYSSIIFSGAQSGTKFSIYVISDSLQNFQGEIKIELVKLDGTFIWQKTISSFIRNDSAIVIYTAELSELLNGNSASTVFLKCSLVANDKLLVLQPIYIFGANQLDLKNPSPTIEIDDFHHSIDITSSVLIKNLYLNCGGSDDLSDNYFDVLPGITYHLKRKDGLLSKTDKVSYKSLFDLLHEK